VIFYDHKKLPISKLLIILSGIIILLNCAIIGYHSVSGHQKAIEAGKGHSERLTNILSDHVELTFLAADLTVRRAVERQYFNALFGNNLSEDTYNNFMLWVDETPQISAMLLADENGQIKLIYRKKGYETWFEGKESIADKEIFYIHKEVGDQDVYFDVSKDKWISDRGLVMMSRRITKINGTFGGVVLALIDNKYLTGFFNSVTTGKDEKMALFYENGQESRFLINMLDGSEEGFVKKMLTPSSAATITPKVTSVVDRDNPDGIFRIYATKSIPNLHIAIATVAYGGDIFAGWRQSLMQGIIFILIFTAFAGVICYFATAMSGQMGRVEKSEKAAITASQAKSEFLANMSHELRTPLNAIIGFSEMLQGGYFGPLNEKQADRIKDVTLCGHHLLDLINDILEFSRGEAGRMQIKESQIEMSLLVAEVTRIFAEKAKADEIRIITNISNNLPKIRADERKIKQILLNLVSNSLKFTGKGGNININAFIGNEGGFVMAVADTGIGMAEEDIPKALSVFGQVHNHTHDGGTGLGLPLCKMLAELHGGSLKLESLEGVGTKVSIFLPKERVIPGNQEELGI